MSFLIWTFPWTFWYYKKITLYNKLSYTCTLIGYFLWFFGGWHIDDINMNDLASYLIKQVDFIVPCVSLVRNHRWWQNVIRTSETPLAGSSLPIFFVFTTFWCHLWSFTTQKHGTMESIHWMENTTLPVGCYKVSWHLHMISNLAVSRNIQNFFASLLWCPIGDQVK